MESRSPALLMTPNLDRVPSSRKVYGPATAVELLRVVVLAFVSTCRPTPPLPKLDR